MFNGRSCHVCDKTSEVPEATGGNDSIQSRKRAIEDHCETKNVTAELF